MRKILSMLLVFCSILFIPIFSVQADSSQLLVEKVVTEPQVVEPGQQFKINFSLKNISDDSIRDINIKLVGIEGKNALGGFSPVNTTNEVYYSKIKKNESAVLSLDMIADSQLKTGNYNMIINISYKYNDSAVQDNKIIGIVINNKANLIITSVDYDDKNEDQKNVKVAFVNGSKSVLNDVMLKVTSNDKQFSKFYGVLEAGDDDTYEVKLPFNKDINGKIEITYKDELNKDGVVSNDLKIKKDITKDNVKKADSNKGVLSSIGSFFKKLFGLGD